VLLTVAAGSGLLLGAGRASGTTGDGPAGQATQAPAGVSRAYQFLNQMMDRKATGTVPRLVQSYTGGVLGTQNYTASSIYDDALIIDAYLAERTADGRARAQAVGTALLSALAQAAGYLAGIAYAQAHGPNENGLGIMAASKDGLTDCEGDSVYASPHTGTTAWYILAARRINPLSTATPISAQ
jgi:hypothetical protein